TQQVRRHYPLRRTEHNLYADGRSSHRRSLLPGASRNSRWSKATLDASLAPLPGHIREDGRRVAVCGAQALRRLAGGAGAVMKAPAAGHTRLIIVGATGMVGGYALRYALDHPTVCSVTAI